jgi:hypothetical protein
MNQFLSLLNAVKIEEAIELHMQHTIQILLNGRSKKVSKEQWLNFLKRKFLNKFNSVVQFKITKVKSDSNQMSFLIHMICKRYTGKLFFTEIQVENHWKNNLIYRTNYKITNY